LRNNYGGSSIRNETNDGVVFITISDDKEEPKKGKRKKRKLVTMQVSAKKNCPQDIEKRIKYAHT